MATTTAPGNSATTTMQKEERRQKWALFLFGNLLTIGSVIYESESLDLCFVEGETNRTSLFGSSENNVGNSGDVERYVVAALWLGVVYEMSSALVLSTTYSSPLDAKSAHKVPPNDNRGHCARLFLRFLTPCIWGFLVILVGLASVRFATFRSCDTNGGTWLTDYLIVSGTGMLLFGSFFLISFMAIFLPIFACCCECVRILSNKLLKTFPYIELFWQLQNVVFGYRSGAFNVYVAVALGIVEVIGAVFSERGSCLLLPPPARVLAQAVEV
ncbi:unnamed protein product [Ectocarpus sp. 13 AM-2016]